MTNTTTPKRRALPRTLVALSTAAVALALGVSVAHPTTDQQSAPDWTVAPCAWWADTSHPVLPPYTRTDVCAQPDGTLSHATP